MILFQFKVSFALMIAAACLNTPSVNAQAAPPSTAAEAAVAASQAEDYERYQPPVKKRGRKFALLIAGVAVFGAGYVGAVVSYALNSDVFATTLLIPVAGPFIALAGTEWDRVDGRLRLLSQLTLGLQGTVQAVGIVLSVIGAIQYLSSGRSTAAREPGLRFALVPTQGGAHAVFSLQL